MLVAMNNYGVHVKFKGCLQAGSLLVSKQEGNLKRMLAGAVESTREKQSTSLGCKDLTGKRVQELAGEF